jgi:tRNA threonylcarbamoyladenosine biosynthesis protein TsaE
VTSRMVFHMFSDNSIQYKLITSSEEETRTLGYSIGKHAYPGLSILLYGDLGMGKTMLTQGIGDALGIKKIKSPTFIIIGEHNADLPLIHVDLYRLENYEEVDALDLESYIDQKCLLVVEWAEHWCNAPAENIVKVKFALSGTGDSVREIVLMAKGANAVNALKSANAIFENSQGRL